MGAASADTSVGGELQFAAVSTPHSHRPGNHPVVEARSEPDDTAATAGERATLGGNAVITIGTQVSVLILGLLASALISRALGPAGRGSYYLPVTTVTVTFALLHLSIEMSITYHFAQRIEPLRRLAGVSATMAPLLGLAGFVLLTIPYVLDPHGQIGGMGTSDLAIAAFALPFLMHSTWLMNVFVLGDRLPRSQAAVVIAAVAQTLALVALGIADLFSVESVLLVYVGSTAVSWLLLVVWSLRFAPAVPTGDRALLGRVVGHGVRIHAAYVAFFLLLRSDVYLVDAYLDLHDVGLYSLAVLFAELVWTVASSLALAALPFQSVENLAEGGAATLRIVRVCLLVAGTLAVGCVSTLWFVLPLLYGEEFSAVYGPMVVLLPGVIAMTVVRPLWNWLLRDGRSARIVVLFVGGFALNVVLNVLLLPAIGLYGASVASSVSYGLIAVVLAIWTLRNTGGRPRDLFPGRQELDTALGLLERVRRRPPAPTDRGPAAAG